MPQMRAKKAAPKKKMALMQRNNSSGESDAEDNANSFGAGFNKFSNV